VVLKREVFNSYTGSSPVLTAKLKVMINILIEFLFGVKVVGEPINMEYGVEQPKRTVQPPSKLPEFEWCQHVRFGSLHNVVQRVHL